MGNYLKEVVNKAFKKNGSRSKGCDSGSKIYKIIKRGLPRICSAYKFKGYTYN